MNVKRTKDNYNGIWCISALFYLPKANVSLTSSCKQYLNTITINGKNFDNGLQFKDIPNLEK